MGVPARPTRDRASCATRGPSPVARSLICGRQTDPFLLEVKLTDETVLRFIGEEGPARRMFDRVWLGGRYWVLADRKGRLFDIKDPAMK
jgi:hypothetical protein